MNDLAGVSSPTSTVGPSPDPTRRAILEHLTAMPHVDHNGRPVVAVAEEPTEHPSAVAQAPTEAAPTRPQPDPSQGQQGQSLTLTPTNPLERVRAMLREGTR